ncbi:hypothetical protein ACFSC3_01140 [Sphingomonas floccifaciens]|uniref:Uncharacterized protein n=2 Tax=Sphingomonas floccifaciens TaxID=1844115 RepID=A0ABW4N812_9SPHN
MPGPYSETTDWQGTAWAFAIWAAHFSLLWGASSVFPDQPPARWIALAGTLVAIGGLAILWRVRIRAKGDPRDSRILTLATGVSALAVLFGALPALVG